MVTVALAEYLDAAVIGVVLVMNAVVGFFQEFRAERSMAALRQLASSRATVLREGREIEVEVSAVVPGDVIAVEAGSRVPADCRLISGAGLEVDESHLTGESTTVAKPVGALAAETPMVERSNMLYTGSAVTLGRGTGIVVATGVETELGAISTCLGEIGLVETPLQARISRLARMIGLAVVAIGVVGFGLGAIAGEDLGELFLAVVALAVSAIPEALAIVLTVALAISVRRMAGRRTIVRRLPAVETLGSCTVIASDKTGTLTQNRMTVERIAAGGESHRGDRGRLPGGGRLQARRRARRAGAGLAAAPGARRRGALQRRLRGARGRRRARGARRPDRDRAAGGRRQGGRLPGRGRGAAAALGGDPLRPGRAFRRHLPPRRRARPGRRQGGAGAGDRDVPAGGRRRPSTPRPRCARRSGWPPRGCG